MVQHLPAGGPILSAPLILAQVAILRPLQPLLSGFHFDHPVLDGFIHAQPEAGYALFEKEAAAFVVGLATVLIYLIARGYLAEGRAILLALLFGLVLQFSVLRARALWQHTWSILLLTLTIYMLGTGAPVSFASRLGGTSRRDQLYRATHQRTLRRGVHVVCGVSPSTPVSRIPARGRARCGGVLHRKLVDLSHLVIRLSNQHGGLDAQFHARLGRVGLQLDQSRPWTAGVHTGFPVLDRQPRESELDLAARALAYGA
jgi:hypothetical protein